MSLGTLVWLIEQDKSFYVLCFLSENSHGSLLTFFTFYLFWDKIIHPISPEAEEGSQMGNAQSNKPREPAVDQVNKVKWLICYFVTFISDLFPF